MRYRRTSGFQGQDDGMTLVEVLVTMVIAGIVGGISVSALTATLGFGRTVDDRAKTQQQAQLAVDQIASQVRSGNVLYAPEEVSEGWLLTVYTQANRDQKCVEWELLTTGELRSRSWAPGWAENNSNADVSDWRVVATGLGNSETGVTPFAVPSEAPYGSRLLTVDLVLVGDRGATTRISTAATGRNTVYQYDESVCGDRP